MVAAVTVQEAESSAAYAKFAMMFFHNIVNCSLNVNSIQFNSIQFNSIQFETKQNKMIFGFARR